MSKRSRDEKAEDWKGEEEKKEEEELKKFYQPGGLIILKTAEEKAARLKAMKDLRSAKKVLSVYVSRCEGLKDTDTMGKSGGPNPNPHPNSYLIVTLTLTLTQP